METFLLTWDPGETRYGAGWSELSEDMRFLGTVSSQWRYAFSRAERGDRVYLLRQREEPRGIVAAGTLTGPVEQIGKVTYVPVLWSSGVDPDEPLPVRELERLVPEQRWGVRSSGERLLHGQDLVAEAWQRHVEQHPLTPWRAWLVRAERSGSHLTWPVTELPVAGDIVLLDVQPPVAGRIVDVVGRDVTLEILDEPIDDAEVELLRRLSGIAATGQDAVLVPADFGVIVDDELANIGGGRVVGRTMQRRGQRRFREALLEGYSNVCAISGPNPPAVLEAAHLRPFAEHETHDVDAGLLLRRDLHRLFDEGLVRIDPDTERVVVDDRLLPFPVYADLDGRELHVRLTDAHKDALRATASRPSVAEMPAAPWRIDPSFLVKAKREPHGTPRGRSNPLEGVNDLLREIGHDDLQGLVDHLADYADEDVDVVMYDDGDFEIRIRGIGADVEFPTTREDVYAIVDGIMKTLESIDEEAEREAGDDS